MFFDDSGTLVVPKVVEVAVAANMAHVVHMRFPLLLRSERTTAVAFPSCLVPLAGPSILSTMITQIRNSLSRL